GVAALVQAAIAASSSGDESAAAASRASQADKSEVVQQLLLEHLATWGPAAAGGGAGSGSAGAAGAAGSSALGGGGGGGGPSSGTATTSVSGSARQLIACCMLAARVKAVEQGRGRALEDVEAAEEVVAYRQVYERKRSCLGASTSGLPPVSRESALLLSRWLVVDSVLGRSRGTLLSWLAEAGGGGRGGRQDAAAHAAAVRAKAIKLLGGAIEADVGVLGMSEVQEGIKGALGDDSVLVREAAVDLIGKHISRHAGLASQYYDVLVRASEDAGLTVRKRGIRLLWECCVRCPDFSRRGDALMRIVQRATDQEETMRALVTKICSEIWFLPKFQIEDEVSHEVSQVTRGPQQRAAQLGEVVAALYGRSSGAAVPFHAGLPIIVTIRGIVGEDGKPEYDAVRSGAREVADALLARALELQGEQEQAGPEQGGGQGQQAGTQGLQGTQGQQAPAAELFQCLLALHALCVADVRLLHRASDPQRVVRCLAPYVKSLPPKDPRDPASRPRAEQLVVVLALLGGCMPPLRHLEEGLAGELGEDLREAIMRVAQVQVVSVAVQCLCTLAALKPQHRAAVREQAALYQRHLRRGLDLKRAAAGAGEQLSGSLDQRLRQFPRFLYALGLLCRHGADILDETVEGSDHPSCSAALDLVLGVYGAMDDVRGVRENALQALGHILISRPQLAVAVPGVRPLLEGALGRSAPAPLKSRCLASLTELLRVEGEALVGRQEAARREAAAAQQASTLPEAEARQLARRNGEGDTSVSSSIVQYLWERILDLATDITPPPQPTQSGTGSGAHTPPPTPGGMGGGGATPTAHGAVVRRRALDLIELVIRDGIVVPWSALPALCALATDPEPDTAARALRCVVGLAGAHTAFVAGQVPAGLERAYGFHRALAAVGRPGRPPEMESCKPLVEGLVGVWSGAFQPDRTLKAKFLTALLKPLDEGCCLASGAAAKSDPHLLAFMSYLVAELPYRKMDELLAVLVRLNDILRSRAEAVLGRFQELRQQAQGQQQQGGKEPAASAPANGAPAAAPPASPLPSRGPCSSASASSAVHAPNGLIATVKAAIAVSLLLLLKKYLHTAYDLSPDRAAKYDPSGPQRKVEEKLNAVRTPRLSLRFNSSKLGLDVPARLAVLYGGGHHNHQQPNAPGSVRSARTATAAAAAQGLSSSVMTGGGSTAGTAAAAATAASAAATAAAAAAVPLSAMLSEPGVEGVYRVLKSLMLQDATDFRQATAGAGGPADTAGGGAPPAPSSPGGVEEAAEALDLVADMATAGGAAAGAGAGTGSKKPPLAARGRGRGAGRGSRGGRSSGTTAAATTGARGRGRAAAPAGSGGEARSGTAGKRGRKRKARGYDSDEEEEEDDGSEDEGVYKPKPTRRRLDKTL
ncbi:hypothetical protein Agub_g13318, partial [Astrephomene gubernaculifera]